MTGAAVTNTYVGSVALKYIKSQTVVLVDILKMKKNIGSTAFTSVAFSTYICIFLIRQLLEFGSLNVEV